MNLLTTYCVAMLLFLIVSSDKLKTPEARVLRFLFLQHGCRGQLRRQGDQEARRARKNILPLENRKKTWDGGYGKGGR